MKDFGFVFFGAAAIALLFFFYLAERQRAAAIQALASRLGFHYLGSALPRSLTLSGTPFSGHSRVKNVIDGEPRGVRTIAFDCQVGTGKGSWRRTVIAVEESGDFGNVLALNAEMRIEPAGKWKVLYRRKAPFVFRVGELMPLEELESYLNSVSTTAGQAHH